MSCPRCGFAADPEQTECPLCGTPLGADAAEGGGGEPRGGSPPDAGSSPASAGPRGGADLTPWEERGGFWSLADSWWESLTEPDRFFARVPWDRGLGRPLVFFLAFWILGAGFEAIWFRVISRTVASALGLGEVVAAGGGGLTSFFLSPFRGLFLLGVAAGALHLSVLVLADRPRSIGATVRALCYAAGPQVLRVVPVLGSLAAALWSVFLAVIGIRSAHRTSTLRAAGAVGIVVALSLLVALATAAYAVFVATQSGNGMPVPGAVPPGG